MLADQFENDTNKKAESQHIAHEESDEEYEKNIKTKILDASLKFVPDLGWSKQAISAGNLDIFLVSFRCIYDSSLYIIYK